MELSVKLNVQSMLEVRRTHEREVRKAASRAVNRAIDFGKTTAKREISTATKIKISDVAKRLSVRGSTPDYLVATLEAHPFSPNLKYFRATQNSKGVAASAWEQRKTYAHSFINKRTGAVVVRTTGQRLPLKGLKGPSVRRTFLRADIIGKIEKASLTRFVAEFESQISFRLGK